MVSEENAKEMPREDSPADKPPEEDDGAPSQVNAGGASGEGAASGAGPQGAEDEQSAKAEASEAAQPQDAAQKAAAEDPAEIQSKREKSWARRIFWTFWSIVFVVAALLGGSYWYVKKALFEEPVPMAAETVVVAVLEGDTSRKAVERMGEAGVRIPFWQVRVLMELEPGLAQRIHVGRFRFTRGMTPYEMLKTLSGPALVDKSVRIPEGAAVWAARSVLSSAEGLGHESAELSDEALAHRLGFEDKTTLEGLLAPDTYRYGEGTSDMVVLKQAAARQAARLEAAWNTRSEDCAVGSPYELLILASIIEKETGIKSDRHLVSSVFNNRLRIGMPLQTDPTVIYGLGPDWSGTLTRQDLRKPSPWNTYLNKGLPPTPISMPSAASIEAAAHPAKSKYLYFVARGDGTSEFSTSLRDHNRAVSKFILRRSGS